MVGLQSSARYAIFGTVIAAVIVVVALSVWQRRGRPMGDRTISTLDGFTFLRDDDR